LAYPAYEGLYVVDEAGEGQYLFRPDDVPGANPVGPVCWMPAGETLKFVVRRWEDDHWRHAFYSMGLDDESPRALFTLDDLESFIWSGICSPDGEEMAVTLNPYGQKADGVYLVELESGEWRQILTHYMIDRIRAPLPASLRETTEALRESGKILFTGTPCRLRGPDCEPLPANPLYYYAINPDGSGLENVLAIPPRVVPPDSAPPIAFDGPVVLSPDGSMLAYAERNGIYVVDLVSGETRRVPPQDWLPERPINSYRHAPVCWTADGTTLKFGDNVLFTEHSPDTRFWVIALDAETTEELQSLFLNPDLMLTWDCSPDGRELAFSLSPQGGEKRGLHVLDLESGEQRSIIDDYEVVSVGVWPSKPLYTFAPMPGSVWQVFFNGAPCAELLAGCTGGFMYHPEHYYSIYSDGTGLQEVAEFPKPSSNSRLSPDGSLLAYYSIENLTGIYIKDIASDEAYRLLGSEDIPSVTSVHQLSPVCWTPDGSGIRFYARVQENGIWKGAFYSIDQNGGSLRRLVASVSLEGLWALARIRCSPDNREILFPIGASDLTPVRESGLYLLSPEHSAWRPILRGYETFVEVVIAPIAER